MGVEKMKPYMKHIVSAVQYAGSAELDAHSYVNNLSFKLFLQKVMIQKRSVSVLLDRSFLNY